MGFLSTYDSLKDHFDFAASFPLSRSAVLRGQVSPDLLNESHELSVTTLAVAPLELLAKAASRRCN
jgi:hypothetical protein